jgi:hypothetical protein
MGPAGLETKNSCAGEGQQEITRPDENRPVQTGISKSKIYFEWLRKLYTCVILNFLVKQERVMIPAFARTWGSQEFP